MRRSPVVPTLAVVTTGIGAIGIAGASLLQAADAGCRQLRLEFLGGLPLTQAGVNGGAPRWFLLDTASTFTFVDASMATSLGLPLRGDMMITGGNCRIDGWRGDIAGGAHAGAGGSSADYERPTGD